MATLRIGERIDIGNPTLLEIENVRASPKERILSKTESAQFIPDGDIKEPKLQDMLASSEMLALASIDSKVTADQSLLQDIQRDIRKIEERLLQEKRFDPTYQPPSGQQSHISIQQDFPRFSP